MKPATLVDAPLAAFVLAAGLALTAPVAFAQGQGGGGGGHTTASTNLSYPAIYTATPVTTNGTEGAYALGGDFGETWSYGCAVPEEEFPNTSCTDPVTNAYQDYATCLARCGVAPERMYFQRESPVAVWQAQSLRAGEDGHVVPVPATHVDWGDNMESQTWSATSVIRVETTTFATTVAQLGFQMWHVSGKGPDELWGVRATALDPADPAFADFVPRPYVYTSPYAIIHAPQAHISFTKLETGNSTCPTTPGGSPFAYLVWDEVFDVWKVPAAEPGVFESLCTWTDLAYTMELNIGGRFVHGYNWQTSRMPAVLCGSYKKEGWWRLTYHNVGGTAVDFTLADTIGPPTLPDAAPAVAAAVTTESEEDETGPLYAPVVDKVNGLSYIDICLKAGKGGGGRR